MTIASVVVKRHDAVAQIVLNRPLRRNALSLEAIERLHEAFRVVSHDPTVGAVVLTGAGGYFCSGLDTKEIDPANGPIDAWFDVHDALDRIEVPVIAGVMGGAINAGAALALGSDLLVVGERSYLQVMEALLGVAAPVNAARLTLSYSAAFARQLMLSSRAFYGPDLLRLGVALDVVPDDEVESSSLRLAAEISAFPTRGATLAKQTLRDAAAGHVGFNATMNRVRARPAS